MDRTANRITQAFTNLTVWRSLLKVLTGALIAVIVLGISDTANAQGVTLNVSPTSLNFNNIPQHSVRQPQNVQLSANQPTSVVIQVVPAPDSSWLQLNPGGAINVGTTASNIAVTANTSGLALGMHSASFTISVSAQNQVTVNVTLTVGTSGTGGVTATPSSLAFTAQQGATNSTPSGTNVVITSSGRSV